MVHSLIRVAAAVVTVIATAAAGEGLLRLKNADQMSYQVEMWRYAKELKQPVADERLGHIHRPSLSARLQNVTISLNSLGLRGPEPDLGKGDKARVLLLGSSITLGWGVQEEDTLRAKLEAMLGGRAQVWNAGIGNYNAERYVTLYERYLSDLGVDVIVVHYFVNDAEILLPSPNNLLLRHSQLALMLWQAALNVRYGKRDLSGLVKRYRDVYAEGSEALSRMEQALVRLRDLAEKSGTRVLLAMMPDIHNLKDYPFGFVHEHMARLAKRLGWEYVDLLKGLDIDDPRSIYAIPGDPHPNAVGHRMMAEVIAPVVERMLD